MPRSSLITLLMLFMTQLVSAQILTVDRPSLTVDSAAFFLGGVDFSYNVNNQKNTVYKGLLSKADMMYVSDLHEYILINQFKYFSSTGSPFISTGYSHFRVNFLRQHKLSYESYAQLQYDKGRNMPFRFLVGGGIRYRLLDRPKNHMHYGIGVMYERERWKSLDDSGTLITPEFIKISSYVSTNTNLNEYIRLVFVGYYQSGYDEHIEQLRNRINISASLVVKINSFLSLTTNVNYQYEDQPIIPINKTIYSVTNGLRLNF
jgi:hypothetical protein